MSGGINESNSEGITKIFLGGLFATGTFVSTVSFLTGLRHGVLASCSAFALGPSGLKTLAFTPKLLAFAPFGFGVLSMAGAVIKRDNYWTVNLWVNFFYTSGTLLGGKLLNKPRVLVPVGVCMVLWQCW